MLSTAVHTKKRALITCQKANGDETGLSNIEEQLAADGYHVQRIHLAQTDSEEKQCHWLRDLRNDTQLHDDKVRLASVLSGFALQHAKADSDMMPHGERPAIGVGIVVHNGIPDVRVAIRVRH
jgi:hypothetical protein